MKLNAKDIYELLSVLNEKLKLLNRNGELLICGGSLLALAYDRTQLTADIDGLYKPKYLMEKLINEVAVEYSLPDDWLNDRVKSYLELVRKETDIILRFSNLVVKGVKLPVLLGMKLMSFRDTKDKSDIYNLVIRYGVFEWKLLIKKLGKYVPADRIALAEVLLEDLFRGTSLSEFIQRHYSYFTDNKDLINGLEMFIEKYNYKYCPTLKEIFKIDKKSMQGDIMFLKSQNNYKKNLR